MKRMEEVVDGEYQTYKARDGAYVRQHFFGKYPELLELVADMSDDEIWRLNRGGHDPFKMFAAYSAASKHKGQPTVILAKTVKGYGMGEAGEGQNTTHQQKKIGEEALRKFRDRFNIPVTDEQLPNLPFVRPAEDSQEMKYLRERGAAMGTLPARQPVSEALQIPDLSAFDILLKSSEDREFSTTMAFVRLLGVLVKDKNIGKQIVPIVPDESRTFGMEGMFRQLGIFSQVGQLYTPQDADQLMFYKESATGQILQEGINEAGGMADWIAAATSYANHGKAMIPFYIYYSMFGFQRIGDLAWAAGDLRARGFLLGGTAGRTTLNGEGLQHQDGHSHLMAATIPNCVSYDPTFAYELAVIVQDGMRRMYQNQEDVFYYLTVMNENYAHPAMPKGAEEGIIKGMYKFSEGQEREGEKAKVQLLGSGTILREVIAAAELLEKDFGVAADVWSVTSLQRIAPRRHRLRALEYPASGSQTARELRRTMSGREDPGDLRYRLHSFLFRPDPSFRQSPLQDAGHGWLRSFRYTQEIARLLRSGSLLRCRRRIEGIGRRRHDPGERSDQGDQALQDQSRQTEPDDGLTRRLAWQKSNK